MMAIPTLVVGLGGTGVLTLRALKRLYEELPEEERVPAAFLAYDFDRSALLAGGSEDGLAPLEDDEFIYLNPRMIQEFLRSLDRNERYNPENILRWFPDRSRVHILSSEVEANGASQLRCLGRLGFFLNDEVIERTLRHALYNVELDLTRLSDHKRVILVSSVAGGTGAGMFIDMAYLARRQEIRPSVWAYLLLPEVFEDVDNGGRIFQNAYACLKELVYLQGQSIPFEAQFYRIPPVEVPVAGEEPFQRIYLARGEAASSLDAIKRTSVQMAATILAQLQRDIQERCLYIASESLAYYEPQEQQGRRSHAFGAASSSLIKLTPADTHEGFLSKFQRLIGSNKLERKRLTDQLQQDIFRRRQRVFDKRDADAQSKKFGLIMLPLKSLWTLRDRSDLEAAILPILESRVLIEEYAGAWLWVYSEDLFHPLEHIKNIEKYFLAYQRQKYRELFHIDRRMLGEPIFESFHRDVRGANYIPDRTPAAVQETAGMPTSAPIRNQVFISYSRKDTEWLDRLRKMLKPLERNRALHVWVDSNIRPGDRWKEEIRRALTSAKVAVLLVSSNFLASDFITEDEVPHLLQAAEQEGVKILWILVSQCPYEATPIGDYQAAHDPQQALDEMPEAMQNRVLNNLARAILEAAS